MSKTLVMITLLVLLLSGCSAPTTKAVTGTPTLDAKPEILTPTLVLTPTEMPPTAAPTLENTSVPTTIPTKPSIVLTTEPKIYPASSGIHMDNVKSQTAISIIKDAGAYWTRFDYFWWNKIEPIKTDPPTYDWEVVGEQALNKVSDQGMVALGLVMYTPEWAQKYPGIACGPIARDEIERFGSFMYDLVQRYSQPPYNIRYWEIGNEEDISYSYVPGDSGFGCWGETQETYFGGEYYAEVLKVVYPQIKAADPQAQVIVGGLLLDCDPNNPPEDRSNPGTFRDCSSSRFLEGILRNDGGKYFDGVSFHDYDYYLGKLGQYGNTNWHSSWDTNGTVIGLKAQFLREVLGKYGYPDKFLIATEMAILCGRDGSEPACQSDTFIQTKSSYIVQSLVSASAENLLGSIWYNLSGWRGSELLNRNDSTPLPSYRVFQFSSKMLNQAIFIDKSDEYQGIRLYRFERADGELWVLWSADGENHEIQLPNLPQAVYNMLGESQEVQQSLVIDLMPVFIEW